MEKKIGLLLVACLAWPLSTLAAPASDIALTGDIVVTATLSEKSVEDAPGTIEVVSAEEIAELGAVTVSEALQWSTGLVVSNETGRAQVPGIRGTGSKHTLVLIDGRRWSAGYKDFIDINQLPVTLIERIEIVRGPGSALYGSDALGGVINIITRNPTESALLEVDARYGNDTYGQSDRYRGAAVVGGGIGKIRTIFSAQVENKNPFEIDGELPEDGDDIQLASSAGRVAYDLAPGHELIAGFEYIHMDQEGDRYYRKAERVRESEEERLNTFLTYQGDFDNGSRLRVGAYRSDHDNDIVMKNPDAPVSDEEDAEHCLQQVEAHYSLAVASHYLTMGAEYRQEEREDASGSDEDLHNTSVFLQDELQIARPLYLVVGARFDEHSEFGSQISPRLSLVYHLNPSWQIKASYSQGFRAPSLSELFITSYRQQGKQVYQPNADLDAESSESYELGLQGSYGRFRGGVTAFYNEIDDLIEAVFSHSTGSGPSKVAYYTHQNITEARMQGIEVEGHLQLPYALSLSAHVTYLDTENKETKDDLEGQPDYQGMAKLAWHPQDSGFTANIRMRYIGDKEFADDDSDAVTLWYLYAGQKLTEQLELYVGVDNLFNRLSDSDSLNLIDPAFYYGGLRWTF
ncbi:TonB-dependent receptor [uncultured Desulfuromonas sp.]|uniref:TonB-dependent receptor plug domain-containing protein n=1 Tax=uncultured Desulfuromonas sp. TaxID=181013 RepID=UPI002AABE4CB|nr:TonB-dependent receptor [uncultured Desulfuromonas sp.]